MSKKVLLYTKDYCPFCHKVTRFLKDQKVEFEQIDITNSPEKYRNIKLETGHQTVPIIFVDEKFIGGSREFFELYG